MIAILSPMNSPTTEQVASHLVELRRVMGLDVSTLAARAQLEPQVVAEIELGTREWTFGLGVTITSIFRRFDPPSR